MQSISLRVFILLFNCNVSPLGADESLEHTIDFLFHRIETADAGFIRNGQTHTPQEAVAHVRAKYEHFKDQIKTPEDFIRLAATKSLVTGQPYLIRPRQRNDMRLSAWLRYELRHYQKDEAK
jgi:hypothetical protein